MTNRQRLLCAVIRGYLNGVLLFLPAYLAAWLVIGKPPAFWPAFLTCEGLDAAVRFFLWQRRRREIRALQAAFDQPAYGDH